MTSIIVAFSKIEDARSIKSVLVRHGFNVASTCQSGAFALNAAENMDGGIVICGYRLSDMLYTELKENLPDEFQMLLVTSPMNWHEREESDIVFEAAPLNVKTLVDTLNMMINTGYEKRKKKNTSATRTQNEKDLISRAKILLMERNKMSENEAHRYLQKRSMESGNSLTETAEMVLLVYSQ